MTGDGFMGPPWQMDWTLKAQAVRDALPEHVRKTIDAVRAELVTGKDPYFRGVDTDVDLPEGMRVFEFNRGVVLDGRAGGCGA